MTQARPPAASWRDNLYVQYYLQQPPVTRTFLTGIAAVSIPPLFYLIKPAMLVNFWDFTVRGEIWRPLTALLYGGGGMELLFGVFFAYQYSMQLETLKFGDSTADYAYYFLFSWIDLMFMNYFIGNPVYFSALTLSLCTTAVLETPNQRTTLFGMIPLESRYLPYALLVLTFVTAGPQQALAQATGFANAHVWRYLRETLPNSGGLNYLATPSWFKRLLGEGTYLSGAGTYAQGGVQRAYGQAFRPQQQATAPIRPSQGVGSNVTGLGTTGARSSGSSTQTTAGRGRFSGTGHTLGGE